MVLGVFGGLSLGLVGISGAGGIDGDVGGGGIGCEQPAAIMLKASAAKVNFRGRMAMLLCESLKVHALKRSFHSPRFPLDVGHWPICLSPVGFDTRRPMSTILRAFSDCGLHAMRAMITMPSV